MCQLDVVDGSRRHCADRAVVVPEEHHLVHAGGGDVECSCLGVPYTGHIHAVAVRHVNHSTGHGSAACLCPARGVAGNRLEGAGHKGCTNVVAAALAVGLPVKAIDILTRVGDIEHTIGIHVRGGADVVGIVYIVAGDVQRATAVAGAVANHPVVHLCAVGKLPAVGSVFLEGAQVGHRGGQT